MAKFTIEDRTIQLVQVHVYEVEAETEQEAIDKYCEELAGAIEPVNIYDRSPLKEGEKEIAVV